MPITYADGIITGEGLCKLITISKGPLLHRFTTWQFPITVGANTWIPQSGCSVTALVFRVNGDVSNAQISVAASFTNLIQSTDAIAGRYRGGDVIVEVCNPFDPDAGKKTWMAGYVGDIKEDRAGEATLLQINCRGYLSRLKGLQEEKYYANCPLDLGEDRCRVPILPADQTRAKVYVTKANASTVDGVLDAGTGFATRVSSDGSFLPASYGNVYFECTTAGTTHASVQPTYDFTVGNTTTDGTAVFTARNAFVRNFEVDSLAANGYDLTLTDETDPRAVDGWFSEGYAIIRVASDPNSVGLLIPIINWVNATTTLVSCDNLTGFVAPGDLGEIIAGCDHRRTTCFTKFDNILNFHGYGTFAPGRSIADATL